MTKNKKTSIAVFGSSGRMGRAIIEEISKNENLVLAAGVDKNNFKELEKNKPDVVIDFSSPEGTLEISRWCEKNNVSLVVGTTGLTQEQVKGLQKAGEKIPVFVSPNMSAGVYGFAEALRGFLGAVREGEVFIEEVHHHHKKDAPSGTAKFLYDVLKETASPGVRVSPPTSVRAGDIFGIHRVRFFAKGEWVSFEHHATGRIVFAQGAVKAAQWLVEQKVGYYQMKEMLQ